MGAVKKKAEQVKVTEAVKGAALAIGTRVQLKEAPKATFAKASFGGKERTVRTDADSCRIFATCSADAVTTVEHSILGTLPACQRCADFMNGKER